MHSPHPLPGRISKPLMQRWQWLPLFAVLALSGCQMRGKDRPLSSEAPPPPVFASNFPVVCRAAEVRFALGQTANGPLLEQVRIRTGAVVLRTVLTTDRASTDVNSGRLTVDVQPSGRIVGARCG